MINKKIDNFCIQNFTITSGCFTNKPNTAFKSNDSFPRAANMKADNPLIG